MALSDINSSLSAYRNLTEYGEVTAVLDNGQVSLAGKFVHEGGEICLGCIRSSSLKRRG